MAESKRIELAFQKLPKRAQIRHRLLVEWQQYERAKKCKELEKERDESIKFYTRKALDKAVTEIFPALKPRHLHADDLAEQEKYARADAIAKVDSIEQATLHAMDCQFLGKQEKLLGQEQARVHQNAFNDKSQKGLSFPFHQGKGRKR